MDYLSQKKEKGRYSETVKIRNRESDIAENHRMHFAGKNKPYKGKNS